MGREDVLMRDYLSDPAVFADVFNYLLFQGKPRIRPDSLQEADSAEKLLLREEEKSLIPVQKYRDLLKRTVMKTADSLQLILLGIEAQSYIDYAMPVRVMLYDALQYAGQVQKHRVETPKTADEFLSGFPKDGKLKPVITAVVLFSARPWDGARCLNG